MLNLLRAKLREIYLTAIILVIAIAVTFKSADFMTSGNIIEIFNDTSILAMLALGQMLVIITRGIDLSVASNLALTGMIVALMNTQFPELSMVYFIVLAIVVGMSLGAINGLLIWKLSLPSIVVTLGTMAIFRGVIFIISNGTWVNSHELSEAFISLPRTVILGFPVLNYFGLATLAAVILFVTYIKAGREIYACGSNPAAAVYTGIDVGKIQCLTFVISGAIAGLCGYLWVARYAVAYVDIANGFELQVVAACVIGGVSIAGGRGSIIGCMLGCLFLGVIKNALPVIGISPFWQMAISGFVIIAAVVLNSKSAGKKKKIILKPQSAALAS